MFPDNSYFPHNPTPIPETSQRTSIPSPAPGNFASELMNIMYDVQQELSQRNSTLLEVTAGDLEFAAIIHNVHREIQNAQNHPSISQTHHVTVLRENETPRGAA